MKQYSDIQFSPICLSNEPIDDLKVSAVAIPLCQWETTMPWFLLRSKTQQAGLNLYSSRTVSTSSTYYTFIFPFQHAFNRYDLPGQ